MTFTVDPGPAPSTARLSVHAFDAASAGAGPLARAMRHLYSIALHPSGRATRMPLGVQVDDLQGRALFAASDMCTRIDVPLPPGTYHVNVRQGERLRRYTVTLIQGSTFDLHLPSTNA